MVQEDVFNQFQDICREVFDDEELTLTATSTSEDVDEWDSITYVQLVVEIEKKFNLKFELEDLQDIETVGDFVDLIQSKL